MPELITCGETMVSFLPSLTAPLRYAGNFSMRYAGAESNTAIGLCRLGHSAGWVSRVGDDEFGRFLIQQIRGEGVDVSRAAFDRTHPTGIMFKQFSAGRDTSVFYYRAGSAASAMSAEGLDFDYLSSAKILHLTGITPALSESCLCMIQALFSWAKQNGILVSFDPNLRLKLWRKEQAVPVLRELLLQCDIALLGVQEASVLLQAKEPDQIFDILLQSGVKKIGLKDGARGAWVAGGQERAFIPAYPAACVDPVGAGDAFNAGFLAGILEAAPLLRCGQLACGMGAFAIMGRGDIESLPSCRRELENYLDGVEPVAR